MGKRENSITFETSVFEATSKPGTTARSLKNAIMWLCAYLDRHYMLKFNKKIGDEITNTFMMNFLASYPLLANMRKDKIEELFYVFRQIRNFSAHLNSQDEIEISDELFESLKRVNTPLYELKKDHRITIYGFAIFFHFYP